MEVADAGRPMRLNMHYYRQAKEIEHLYEASLEQLIELANNHDEDALQLFQEIGCNISIGITNIIKTK